jgi:hypothetical protein
MKSLHDLLHQKEQQLQLLAHQVEALRVAVALMDQEQALLDQPTEQAHALSQASMIRQILLEKGIPMHVKEIAQAVKSKFGKDIKAQYLTALIYRYRKRRSLFSKAEGKPNTFGLLEWEVNRSTLPRPEVASRPLKSIQ